MRIAYIANIRFPSERAHAVQIVSMANAFASVGHEVTLHVTSRSTTITEDPEAYYGVSFLFKLIRIRIPDIVGVIHSFPRLLHPYLYALERILFGCACAFRVSPTHYDIVYCRDEWVLACYALLRPRMRIVWESHDGAAGFCARRILFRRDALTVVVSPASRDAYVQLHARPESILVAPGAVDDRFFAPHISQKDARQALGLSRETRPIALYIGGFDQWKGVHTFFEAAALIPHIAFVAIGGKTEELDGLVRQYPTVRFLGPRPYKELPQHQQAADVLVVPNTAQNTHSAMHTSPLKLFAHMTSGIPIVISDIRSLRDILGPDAAFLVPPDNPEALAHTISEVLAHRTDAHERAIRAYAQSQRHSWRARAESITHFIDQ
jgi:glycosyltransferase involved in cell wall biosynthesis